MCKSSFLCMIYRHLLQASPPRSRIVDQIAKARETIKQTLEQVLYSK